VRWQNRGRPKCTQLTSSCAWEHYHKLHAVCSQTFFIPLKKELSGNSFFRPEKRSDLGAVTKKSYFSRQIFHHLTIVLKREREKRNDFLSWAFFSIFHHLAIGLYEKDQVIVNLVEHQSCNFVVSDCLYYNCKRQN